MWFSRYRWNAVGFAVAIGSVAGAVQAAPIDFASSEGLALADGTLIAQIVPDGSLGSESSVIKQDVEVRGDAADLIEGGGRLAGRICFTVLASSMSTPGSGFILPTQELFKISSAE